MWHGLAGYGRGIPGTGVLTGQVEFVYQGVYRTPADFYASFAGFGDDVLVGSRTRQEIAFVAPFRSRQIGSWDARAQGLGAWTLDVHHAYDVNGRKLYLGDGSTRDASQLGTTTDRVIPLDHDTEYEQAAVAFTVAPNSQNSQAL